MLRVTLLNGLKLHIINGTSNVSVNDYKYTII